MLHRLADFKLFSSLAKMLVGLWLLLPYWDTFNSAVAFSYMQYAIPNNIISSEATWGLFFFISGICSIIGYALNKPSFYIAVRLVSNILWVFWATSILLGYIGSTGVPLYITLALFDIINTIEYMVNKGESHD